MNYNAFKGLSELKLYSIEDKSIYNLPTPTDFLINFNFNEKKIGSKNLAGESVTAENFVYSKDPFIRVSFTVLNPETLTLNLDSNFNTFTDFRYSILKTFDLTNYLDNTTINLDLKVLTSLDINKIVKLKAFTTKDTFSIPICINNDPEVLDLIKGYYYDGILSLSSNDFKDFTVLNLDIEYRDTVLSLSNSLNKIFKLFITLVTDKDTVSIITADKVKPRLDTGTIDSLDFNSNLINCYLNLLTPPQRSDFYI